LKHKKLFPSLHFNTPNSMIDFGPSAVRVNTQLRDWDSGQPGTRRCGVSSFGLSGTNAHLVLEESPVSTIAGASNADDAMLITLSAKTRPALDRYIDRLLEFLATTDLPLADISAGLNLGRDDYSHRFACVAEDKFGLMHKLEYARRNGG